MLAFYRQIGRILAEEPAYAGRKMQRLQAEDQDCWWSLRGEGEEAILCVVNTRNQTLKSNVPSVVRRKSFVNLFDQSTAYLQDTFEIEPYGFRLFKPYKALQPAPNP
jgi:hypothetical protein